MTDLSTYALNPRRKPQPIIRPFSKLDRVDQAREVFKYRRQGMTATQIATAIGTSPDVVRSIAREEGISLPSAHQVIWPDKDDPGIPAVHVNDPWSWPKASRASHQWGRMTRAAREQREAIGAEAPQPVLPAPAPEPVVEVEEVREPVPEVINPLFTVADRIIAETAKKHRLTIPELKSHRRQKAIIDARYECFWRISKETSMSLPQIARKFGGFDHTTVLHGIRRHAERSQGISERRWYNPSSQPKPVKREPVFGVGGWH